MAPMSSEGPQNRYSLPTDKGRVCKHMMTSMQFQSHRLLPAGSSGIPVPSPTAMSPSPSPRVPVHLSSLKCPKPSRLFPRLRSSARAMRPVHAARPCRAQLPGKDLLPQAALEGWVGATERKDGCHALQILKGAGDPTIAGKGHKTQQAPRRPERYGPAHLRSSCAI